MKGIKEKYNYTNGRITKHMRKNKQPIAYKFDVKIYFVYFEIKPMFLLDIFRIWSLFVHSLGRLMLGQVLLWQRSAYFSNFRLIKRIHLDSSIFHAANHFAPKSDVEHSCNEFWFSLSPTIQFIFKYAYILWSWSLEKAVTSFSNFRSFISNKSSLWIVRHQLKIIWKRMSECVFFTCSESLIVRHDIQKTM